MFKQISCFSIAFFAFQSLMISDIAHAENLSSPKFSQQPVELAQTNQAEVMLNQMSQSMTMAFEEIPTFVNGLSQMNSVENDEQLSTLLQQLTPIATRITGNFAQAYQISQQISPMIPANSQEGILMNQIMEINGQGATIFGSWIDILMPMQEAIYTQNMNQFQMATGQMPNIINQTMMFMNSVQAFVDNNQTNYANSNAVPNNQSSLDDINTLSNISSQTYQMNMNILQNINTNSQ